jgi:hypothetical protein
MSRAKQPVVRVRLVEEPCLWGWDILDADGRLVQSSWVDDWVAFPHRAEAAAAGARRLTELAGTRRMAGVGRARRRMAPEGVRRVS